MGYAIAMSPCAGCGRIFGYNPHLVPSVFVNGVREPVCADCVEAANPRRVANGLEPFPPPHPDAYQPIDESQL